MKNNDEIIIKYLEDTHCEGLMYTKYSSQEIEMDYFIIDENYNGYYLVKDKKQFLKLNAIIPKYNNIFNRCYVVCVEDYEELVSYRIPIYWGELVIKNERIDIVRAAKNNVNISLKDQLKLLSEDMIHKFLDALNVIFEESEDIDTKVGYILENARAEAVAKKLHQLLLNPKSQDATIEQIVDLKEVFEKSQEEKVEEDNEFLAYKTRPDGNGTWLEIYREERQSYIEYIKKENELNKEVTNNWIGYKDIDVSLGAPWISVDIIKSFIAQLLQVRLKKNSWDLLYEEVSGSWKIDGRWHLESANALTTVQYGLKEYTAVDIIEATLNLREIKVNRNGDFSEEDTLAAIEKQNLINERFRTWIFEDKERINEIEKKYNEIFSTFEQKKYDGSDLEFEGINPDIELYAYQKDAVKKIVEKKNSLLAFDVGTGKTFIMIASAMELKKCGKTKKCMFVVPNNIVGQWASMFKKLYPLSNTIVIEPKNFRKNNRNEMLAYIRDTECDGIIIAYSCFELIEISPRYLKKKIVKKTNDLRKVIEKNLQEGSSSSAVAWKNAQIEQEIGKYTSKINTILEEQEIERGEIFFDDLNIDTIYVDEAHNYKNLPIDSRMKNLRGVNIVGSKKCLELLLKVRCVQEKRAGGGVVFSTGTPLCNSIADAYVMQVYLQNDDLERLKISKFDNWVKTFARPEQVCEVDVDTSGYRFVRRFTSFNNLPELSKMFSEISDFYASSISKDIPEFNDYTDVVIPKSKELDSFMKELNERTDKIRTGQISRREDNMLKVSTDGRKAALDLTLVGLHQEYNENSKIFRCVENVFNIYDLYDGCSQLIFCDNSTPKGEDFSVYNELKLRLVEKGIKEDEIQFIHTFITEAAKLELYDNVNSGKVRVLIGSTFKLGIGANVQTKLKAIHHLDVPWRPADMVQREGRILRKGNENKEIYIYRYIIEGSFDAYSWQILETKQTFISQFLTGSAYQRSSSDLEDNILSFAEVKALALSSPLLKDLTEKQNELRNYKILYMKEVEAKEDLNEKIQSAKQELSKKETDLVGTRENDTYISSLDLSNIKAKAEEVAKFIKLSNLVKGKATLGEIYGFDIMSPTVQSDKKPFYYLARANVKYMVPLQETEESTVNSLSTFFRKFSLRVKNYEQTIDQLRSNLLIAEKTFNEPIRYKKKLEEKQRECDEILGKLKDE